MSEFVRKSALGYKPVPGGYSDPELTHVILTKAEYDSLRDQIQAARKETTIALDKVAQVERQAASKIQQIKTEAGLQLEDLQRKLDEEALKTEYQKGLNTNLLRISKERANAARKLKPKKEHSGYVVISSAEKSYSYKKGANRGAVMLWETVLQTPFSVDFTEEQARTETEDLFQKDESGAWPIGKIGINGQYLAGYGEMIRDKNSEEWAKYNVMVNKKLRANFRVGYWELILLHTKPLDVVPAEMRP